MGLRLKKQKVVLRGKVRQERWARVRSGSLWVLKLSVLAGIACAGYVSLDRFAFHSGRFAVARVDVKPGSGPLARQIESEAAVLKGQSLFRAPVQSFGQSLRKKYPELRTLSVSRSFPDKITVAYALRTPAAWAVREGGSADGKKEAVDAEGVCFPADDTEPARALPGLVFRSTATLRPALAFLKDWSGASSPLEMSLSTGALKKIEAVEAGDIALYVEDPARPGAVVKVAWGAYDAGTFAQKFGRFQDVWADLGRKGMAAQYVNLREVPQKNASVLGDSEIVGRVFVRTTEEPR